MQEDSRSFFEQLRDVPLVTSADSLAQWASIARQREPWRSMPADDLLGELSAVVSVMLREVPRHEEPRPNFLELIARSHGSFRRRQGLPASTLTEEATMLGEAFHSVLQCHGVSEIVAEAVAAFLDRDLRLVHLAMSAGYMDGPSCSPR
jgi:hypothetical protein